MRHSRSPTHGRAAVLRGGAGRGQGRAGGDQHGGVPDRGPARTRRGRGAATVDVRTQEAIGARLRVRAGH